jgi:hypothetical protein
MSVLIYNTLTHAFGLLIFLLAAPSVTAGSSLLCLFSLYASLRASFVCTYGCPDRSGNLRLRHLREEMVKLRINLNGNFTNFE